MSRSAKGGAGEYGAEMWHCLRGIAADYCEVDEDGFPGDCLKVIETIYRGFPPIPFASQYVVEAHNRFNSHLPQHPVVATSHHNLCSPFSMPSGLSHCL